MMIWAEIPKKASSLCKLNFLSINYVSRKKLNINGKLNVSTVLTTKCNPERFTIVTKQDVELLHRECSLTLEGWLRTNGIGLIDTEPLLYTWESFNYRTKCQLREMFQKIQPPLTTDYVLTLDVFSCSKVNLANENIVLNCYGWSLSLPKMTSCLLKSCQ